MKRTRSTPPPAPGPTPPPIKPTLPWKRIVTQKMAAPGVDYSKLPKGQPPPEIVVADQIDSAGLHWRRWGEDQPVLLDTPPEPNAGDGGSSS